MPFDSIFVIVIPLYCDFNAFMLVWLTLCKETQLYQVTTTSSLKMTMLYTSHTNSIIKADNQFNLISWRGSLTSIKWISNSRLQICYVVLRCIIIDNIYRHSMISIHAWWIRSHSKVMVACMLSLLASLWCFYTCGVWVLLLEWINNKFHSFLICFWFRCKTTNNASC